MTQARPATPTPARAFWVLGLAALLLPVLFALYSGQAWDDYWITFRSSRNLAEGHGLVYQVGERVHTFTSPLGVLVPALGFRLTQSDPDALWFLRLTSAVALGGAAVLLIRTAGRNGWPAGAAAFAVCVGLMEAKVVAFSANGMETAFLVLAAAWTWAELARPEGPRWRALGAGYAALMWTRPDACVLAFCVTLSAWIFVTPRQNRASSLRAVAAAIALGVVLYAPWIGWAWWYYGSPIPQTIIAKSAYSAGISLHGLLLTPLRFLQGAAGIDGVLQPAYAQAGWSTVLTAGTAALARIAALAWLWPRVPSLARAASFALLLGAFYLQQIMPYPWYFAPWTLLAAVALAGLGLALAAAVPRGASATRVAGGTVAAAMLLTLGAQAYTARQQQALVEDEGRHKIGDWLREHAAPGDRVFLEPIGYIGYYSRLKILDYPGLTAPEVSRIIRSGPGGYARLIRELRPEWLVLRPFEITQQNLATSGALAAYDSVQLWSQRAAIDAVSVLPGRAWLQFDAEFVVFHRRPEKTAP